MKKIPLFLTVTAVTAFALTACSPAPVSEPAQNAERSDPASPYAYEHDNNELDKNFDGKLEITIKRDNGGAVTIPEFPSARRKSHRDPSGTYAIEYVHTPYGTDPDESLYYSIAIDSDNTYTMTVVSDGVRSEHSGHWYMRFGGITFFFDEEIDPAAHNYYVSDSLYGEMLPGGKIMIFDNCSTIVLSKTDDVPTPEIRLYSADPQN